MNLFVQVSIATPLQNKSYVFSFCEAEYGKCMKKCTVTVIGGSNLGLGSYIKVFIGKDLIGEGYVLKHKSGDIFILKNKKDVNNPEIHGGCADDGNLQINLNKKEIWGC
jgi:hypothetical protein